MPVAEMHSIIVVQVRDPGCFLIVIAFSEAPSTRPLLPWPSRMPVSSILYWCWGGIFLISGRFNSAKNAFIRSVEAPLIRFELIRLPLIVFISGFRWRNPVIYLFPRGWWSPCVARIRWANSLSWLCDAARPNESWIRAYLQSCLFWYCERRCKASAPCCRDWLPWIRENMVDLGTPQRCVAICRLTPQRILFKALEMSDSV